MNNPFEQPPLDQIITEQILYSLYKVDEQYWPRIAEFQVPRFIPLSVPVPPQRRLQLLKLIEEYASSLFKTEADHYEPFRGDRLYPTWLSRLSNRVAVHVSKTVDKVEESNPDATLWYHGASSLNLNSEVQMSLSELIKHYIGQDTESHPQEKTSEAYPSAAPVVPDSSKPQERQRLLDSYRVAFPSVGIMDICWAAEQHYREWTRWLKGELKDGSKPDRSFRHVLTSNRDAREIRKVSRPKGWK